MAMVGRLRSWAWIATALLIVFVAATAPTAVAQQQPTGPRSVVELIRVHDDVYSFRYLNHITMFVVTDEGVITADPLGQQSPRAPFMLKEAIRSVTEQPVRYVLITHWGADHGMGGAAFADTARFISHPLAAERIAQANDPTTPVPDILVTESLPLELGGKKVDIYFTGKNQGDDYLVLHYPARKVAFAVDFIRSKGVAFRDFPNGDVDDWVQSLNWIDQNLEIETLLLGHPPAVVGKEALVETRQYLLDLMTAIRNARTAGHADNSEAMVAAVKAELSPSYNTWGNLENFLPLNISGAIRSMGS
jgi:glyoxylase-like metal-dependent hydrolase (beta-lactamase superfamily II)